MIGYFQNNQMRMDMLKLATRIIGTFIVLLLFSCNNNNSYRLTEDSRYKVSSAIVGEDEYWKVYRTMVDSFNYWIEQKLGSNKYCGDVVNCYIDSLICFNTEGDRFIGARLMQRRMDDSDHDDFNILLGQKIDGHWYYTESGSYMLPRKLIRKHPISKPFSYQQLHYLAHENLYRVYLRNNKVNNNFFINEFENVGWGYVDYSELKINEDSASYRKNFYRNKIRRNHASLWALKHTVCDIYKASDIQANYAADKKTISIRFPNKSSNEDVLYNERYGCRFRINNISVKPPIDVDLKKGEKSIELQLDQVNENDEVKFVVNLSEVGNLSIIIKLENSKVKKITIYECRDKEEGNVVF